MKGETREESDVRKVKRREEKGTERTRRRRRIVGSGTVRQ